MVITDQPRRRATSPTAMSARRLAPAIITLGVIAALLASGVPGAPLLTTALLVGVATGTVCVLRGARREQRAHAAAQAALRSVLESVREGVVVTDDQHRVVFMNSVAAETFGCDAAAAVGLPPGADAAGFCARDGRAMPTRDLPSGLALNGEEVDDMIVGIDVGGVRRWTSMCGRIAGTPEGAQTVVVTVRDVTEQMEADTAAEAENAQLRHRALHDSLTGLPNRTLLMDRLSHAKQNGERRGTATGLMVIDLDGFKAVNDTLGHAAGDEVLVQVAVRLRTILRVSDTAARLGGDEFVVLCEDLHPAMADLEVHRIGERVQSLLNEPYTTTAGPASVGASVGWAIAQPNQNLDLELIVAADAAMMADKRDRKHSMELPAPTKADPLGDDGPDDRMTVLVVDDDPAMRLLAVRILESSSGTHLSVIGEAANGEEAISAIITQKPDLVLCDVMMPGMSGPEVVDKVHELVPDQRFVFWSATTAPELRRYEAELGVPFVLKDRIEELPVMLLDAAQSMEKSRLRPRAGAGGV